MQKSRATPTNQPGAFHLCHSAGCRLMGQAWSRKCCVPCCVPQGAVLYDSDLEDALAGYGPATDQGSVKGPGLACSTLPNPLVLWARTDSSSTGSCPPASNGDTIAALPCLPVNGARLQLGCWGVISRHLAVRGFPALQCQDGPPAGQVYLALGSVLSSAC